MVSSSILAVLVSSILTVNSKRDREMFFEMGWSECGCENLTSWVFMLIQDKYLIIWGKSNTDLSVAAPKFV